jgi:anti-sigma-K factor RskA
MGLLAALLACRNFELTTTVRIMQNESELAQVDVLSLKQQLDAERILATREIADLKAQPANEPITFVTLVAPQSSGTKLIATIVWQPTSQVGAFISDQLPRAAPDEEYRLWLADASGHSVSAGTITVGPTGTTRVHIKPDQPVRNSVRITLTRERKGTVAQPSGPIVLTGAP